MSKEVTEAAGEASRQETRDYVEPPPPPLFQPSELGLWSFYRAVIAEFIATLLFLDVTAAAVIGYMKETDLCGGVGLLGIAWAFGGMIFILVYCTAGISGGHINLPFWEQYVVEDDFNAHGGATNTVAATYSKGTALGAEIIGTFVLVYTVFSATDPKRNARDSHVPVLAPLPIGFAVFMVHLATIPISGTGINPARSFGAAVIYNKEKVWDGQWVFWVGPFVGALAATIYQVHTLNAAAMKALGYSEN